MMVAMVVIVVVAVIIYRLAVITTIAKSSTNPDVVKSGLFLLIGIGRSYVTLAVVTVVFVAVVVFTAGLMGMSMVVGFIQYCNQPFPCCQQYYCEIVYWQYRYC